MSGHFGWIDALIATAGIGTLVLAFVQPHYRPLHLIVAVSLLAIETIRLLRKLDA